MTTAIAVMARVPLPGRCKTRLLRAYPAPWIAALQTAMLRDTLERLATLDATTRLLLVAPLEDDDAVARVAPLVPAGWEVCLQSGDGLGERLGHALARLFARVETSRAMIVGSDCPHLPLFPPHVLEAREDVLLGPTDDGGYYLVAPSRCEAGIFRGIAWSTPRVLEETQARCAELSLSVGLLPRSYDVDEPEDVERLASELARDPALAPRTAEVLRAR